jgi:tetratricopeptide (TPR) repeat protein
LDEEMLTEARHLYTIAEDLLSDKDLIHKTRLQIEKIDQQSAPQEEPETDDVFISSGSAEEDLEIILSGLPNETEKKYRAFGDTFLNGYLLLNTGEFEAAAEQLEKALTENPHDNSLIHIELANALINTDQADKAEKLLEASIKTSPDSLQGVLILFDLYCDKQEYGKATKLIDHCDPSIRNTVPVKLLKANLLLNQNELSMAEALYNDIMKSHGWNYFAAKALGDILFNSGKFAEAQSAYGKIMDILHSSKNDINTDIRTNYALSALNAGNVSKKILTIFYNLADEDPSNADEHLRNAGLAEQMMSNNR